MLKTDENQYAKKITLDVLKILYYMIAEWTL